MNRTAPAFPTFAATWTPFLGLSRELPGTSEIMTTTSAAVCELAGFDLTSGFFSSQLAIAARQCAVRGAFESIRCCEQYQFP